MTLGVVAHFVLTLTTTAHVLCAETSYDRADTENVMQVIRNRTQASRSFRRLRGAFPRTYLGVVTQKSQFAKPSQCYPRWLRAHHFAVALRGITGGRLKPHKRIRGKRVLFFVSRAAYGRPQKRGSTRPPLRTRWRKTRIVAHTHRGRGKRGHVYMKFRKSYLTEKRQGKK